MKSLSLTVLLEQQNVRRSSAESLLDVQASASTWPPAVAQTGSRDTTAAAVCLFRTVEHSSGTFSFEWRGLCLWNAGV